MARADKFKLKSWYSVLAPKMFDEKKVGEILGMDDASVMHRIINTNLSELSGEMQHGYTRVNFRIHDVKGKTAYTNFVGHELIRSYIKTLARRNMSLVDNVVKVNTKDNVKVSVKTAIITTNRISRTMKSILRKEAEKIIIAHAKIHDFDTFMQEILYKKLSTEIYKRSKEYVPIKRVEVIKTEVEENLKIKA
jgi:small subunit ribosomal protein S3Ae